MSLRSMTAYGEATASSSLGQLTCQIQSTNRRHLELSINLPRAFVKFAAEARTLLSQKLGRGEVYLNCNWKPAGESVRVTPNLPLACAMKEGWEKIAKELKLPSPFSLEYLRGEESLFMSEEKVDEVGFLALLHEALEKALSFHVQMREREGAILFNDLYARSALLEEKILLIEKKLPEVVANYREKLQKKLRDIFVVEKEIEERLLKELALFAEKADITEEIVRFKAHLDSFRATLKTPLPPPETKGKKMEFQLQELGREINTIGSKSMDSAIAGWVIEIKSELEKIREQVQNIE